ncbi:glycosyltransferase [Candidatus Woesearchaeota archaeon]|nr:glycosyltransferase [Candidatus Woesearchaeota archaeon]
MAIESKKMKLLLVSPQVPSTKNGGASVMRQRVLAMQKDFDITLVSRTKEDIPKKVEGCKKSIIYKKYSAKNFIPFFYITFIKTTFLLYKELIKEKYPIVQLEFYETLYYGLLLRPLQLFLKFKICYTAHDVKYLFFRPNSLKANIAKVTEKYLMILGCDRVFVWGDDDYKDLTGRKISSSLVRIMPAIFQEPQRHWKRNKKTFHFVFCGSHTHIHNWHSVDYLLTQFWPEVKKLSPNSTLFIAGFNKEQLQEKYDLERVEALGYVKDFYGLLDKCNFMFNPIVSGTGFRIKTADSYAYGIPVMTHEMGLRNYTNIDKTKVMCADEKKEQIHWVKKILKKPEILDELSKYERKYYRENFSEKNVELYKKYYAELLE